MSKPKKTENKNNDYPNESKYKRRVCFYTHLKKAGKIYLFVIATFLYINAKAQDITNNKFGKGIQTLAKDSSFYMKFSIRMQNRFDGIHTNSSPPAFKDKFYLKRARLKFDGFAFSPKLGYKMELDVIDGTVLDAVIKWNFARNFYLWVGQTKLPGNRERVISSQQLQFVDRSLLNAKFTIDRDKGVQLRHHFDIGGIVIREIASVSIGEGKNFTGSSTGHDYTSRLEILPFGGFMNDGDYFGSDLKREERPKLALGITYDYNDKAVKSGGQLGEVLSETRNLSTVFADMIFKYRGLSLMAEYANKTVSNGTPTIIDTSGAFLESFYTGRAVNAQLGYLVKNNWEVAGRYTLVTPERITTNNEISQYTFGISKYIVGHSLKIQSDFSLIQEESRDDELLFRLQVEMAF